MNWHSMRSMMVVASTAFGHHRFSRRLAQTIKRGVNWKPWLSKGINLSGSRSKTTSRTIFTSRISGRVLTALYLKSKWKRLAFYEQLSLSKYLQSIPSKIIEKSLLMKLLFLPNSIIQTSINFMRSMNGKTNSSSSLTSVKEGTSLIGLIARIHSLRNRWSKSWNKSYQQLPTSIAMGLCIVI